MQNYKLPKAGLTARIDMLGPTDLHDVMALQEKTRAALPESMKMFVLPQGSVYFQNLLMRQTGMMVGIRSPAGIGGMLIAQMALMGPMVLRDAMAEHFITYNDIPFHHAGLGDSVAIFKSMAVHPDWRGNELANTLVSFALGLPFTKVADHVFCQVSAGNRRSWDVFAKAGFGIVGAAYAPKDGMPRFVFQKPAIPFDLAPEVIADEVDPQGDFSAIVNLTRRDGLIGFYDKSASGKLAFMRSRDLLNVMPTVARVTAGE